MNKSSTRQTRLAAVFTAVLVGRFAIAAAQRDWHSADSAEDGTIKTRELPSTFLSFRQLN